MLGSYGLLGIFVYCEHKAGSLPPTRLFWVPVLLSVDHVKINGDIHTDQESQERRRRRRRMGGVLAGDCGSLEERRSSLPGNFHQHCPKHK